MDFIAIDVETANADMASICQIGIAKFSNGQLVDEWKSLINPEDYFSGINIGIHGITECDVLDAPTFPEVLNKLHDFMGGTISACHSHFDRVSIGRAINKHSLEPINTKWLDTAKVARRTWDECRDRGYGLSNVCKIIDHQFKHHDALEDAKACGFVLIAAMAKTELDIESILVKSFKSIHSNNLPITKDGNPEGDLFGEVLVFTGALVIPRREAAVLASNIGCKVAGKVTKKTTLLVVGDQDVSKLAGKVKSSNHLKAEELIVLGQGIRILKESDFQELILDLQK
jgi:DNA polymerase-3 subunit epsilon